MREYLGEQTKVVCSYDICKFKSSVLIHEPALAVNTIFTVPVMHINQRHQPTCVFQFHPTYQAGAGKSCGENIEASHSSMGFLVKPLRTVCLQYFIFKMLIFVF